MSCNMVAEYYAIALPKLAEPVKYPSCKCIVVGTFAGKNAAIVRTGQGLMIVEMILQQCKFLIFSHVNANKVISIEGFLPAAHVPSHTIHLQEGTFDW